MKVYKLITMQRKHEPVYKENKCDETQVYEYDGFIYYGTNGKYDFPYRGCRGARRRQPLPRQPRFEELFPPGFTLLTAQSISAGDSPTTALFASTLSGAPAGGWRIFPQFGGRYDRRDAW